MSTNKQSIASSEHDDVPAAPLSSPVASLSQRTPLESLRQADESPIEATISLKAGRADSPKTTAEALTLSYHKHSKPADSILRFRFHSVLITYYWYAY